MSLIAKLAHDRRDVGPGRQPGLIAEASDLEGRSGASEMKMRGEALVGRSKIGGDISAVENIAGA